MSAKVQIMHRLSRWLLGVVFLFLLGSVGVWLYHSDYFPIKSVRLQGSLKHSNLTELHAIAKKYIRGNILRADLNGAQAAFAQMPWIAEARVSRRLPDVVEIKLVERVPVARWDEHRLVDTRGELFTVPYENNLPIFEGQEGTGQDMVRHYAQFQTLLQKHKLQIVKLIYTSRSAWSIILSNGLEIRLGREHEQERLLRFIQVWPSLIAPQTARLEYVDMRYKDGFSVREKKNVEAIEAAASESQNNNQ
ncbi:MAG: cell division protein FtsQ/DivIB [Neisseria sp.]|nr:cell division protein FtsQ/DivIB [Neisseria sp.]